MCNQNQSFIIPAWLLDNKRSAAHAWNEYSPCHPHRETTETTWLQCWRGVTIINAPGGSPAISTLSKQSFRGSKSPQLNKKFWLFTNKKPSKWILLDPLCLSLGLSNITFFFQFSPLPSYKYSCLTPSSSSGADDLVCTFWMMHRKQQLAQRKSHQIGLRETQCLNFSWLLQHLKNKKKKKTGY